MAQPLLRANDPPAMSARRRYRHPPVVEAMIDLHVAFDREIDHTSLLEVIAGEADRYPQRDMIMEGELTVDFEKWAAAGARNTLFGHRFFSRSRQEIIQARRDGFAFAKVPSDGHTYTEWEEWVGEARRMWDRYSAVMQPNAVTRLAVRYINKIELPGDFVRAEDYFRVYAEAPDTFPPIHGVLLQLATEQPDMPGAQLMLKLGTLPPRKLGVVPLLLDLELSQSVRFPPDHDIVWEQIEKLHERENEIFESCLTDKARELFDADV